MTDPVEPSDTYFTAQFASITGRIAARAAQRRRKKRLFFVTGAVSACLALTGAAIGAIQASEAQKAISFCHRGASPDSDSTEISGVPENGVFRAPSSMAARTSDAEEQCAAAWRIGVFGDDGPRDGPDLPSPALFTCLRSDGRLAVFPRTPSASCATIGMRAP